MSTPERRFALRRDKFTATLDTCAVEEHQPRLTAEQIRRISLEYVALHLDETLDHIESIGGGSAILERTRL
jgi:hypothetical protein